MLQRSAYFCRSLKKEILEIRLRGHVTDVRATAHCGICAEVDSTEECVLQFGDCYDDSMTNERIFGNAACRQYDIPWDYIMLVFEHQTPSQSVHKWQISRLEDISDVFSHFVYFINFNLGHLYVRIDYIDPVAVWHQLIELPITSVASHAVDRSHADVATLNTVKIRWR